MNQKVSCKFCASRCGMVIRWEGKRMLNIKGDPDHRVSRGWTCARGRAATAKIFRESAA